MLRVFQSGKFKKDVKRIRRRGWDVNALWATVRLLQLQEPLPYHYKDHALAGDRYGLRSVHIRPNWVLIYQVIDDELLLVLAETDTHDDAGLE
jgi:mRNA interferase YafQ